MPIKEQQNDQGAGKYKLDESPCIRYCVMKSMIALIFMFVAACQSTSEITRNDKLNLYNDALCQIIDENYFQFCVDFDVTSTLRKNLISGDIDSSRYLVIVDSLKSARRGTLPKCVLDYSNEFQIFTPARVLDSTIKMSIAVSLETSFVNDYFDGSIDAIIDTLSQTAELQIRDLLVDYLEIVPYARKPYRPFGDGIGVISLSKVLFDATGRRAILFYEFNCGPRCGSGKIVFLERSMDKWNIVGQKRVWDN
jgi:hypothetical protein